MKLALLIYILRNHREHCPAIWILDQSEAGFFLMLYRSILHQWPSRKRKMTWWWVPCRQKMRGSLWSCRHFQLPNTRHHWQLQYHHQHASKLLWLTSSCLLYGLLRSHCSTGTGETKNNKIQESWFNQLISACKRTFVTCNECIWLHQWNL